jgi:hypothetical protein
LIRFDEAAFVKEKSNIFGAANSKVMTAIRAGKQIIFELFFKDNFFARRTFRPQTVGHFPLFIILDVFLRARKPCH